MKNLLKLLISSAMIVLAVSCVKENNIDSASELTRKYTLSFDEATKTELSGTGSTRQVHWSEGDEIKYYTVAKQASAASTSVSIDGSSAYVEIPRGRNDEFINAVYGTTQLKSSTSTESIMYVTSPVKDAQRFTSFAEAHICAAFSNDIENPELKFHNATPVFTFTSVAAVSKVVFHGNNDEIITGGRNGDLKISYSGGAITTDASSSGGKSVTIATNGDALDFYFAVLPVSFANGITIDCYDADNALLFSKKASGPINTVSGNGNGTVKVLNLGNAQDWIASAPPTAIDLGLSVKWASFNLGATRPEEYGDYFAWGETAPKGEYKWANYQLGASKNGPFSKYVIDASYGTVDHKTVLDLADDAAHTAWGDDWRMPTKEEVSELMNSSNCTWTWTTKNGVPGYKVTSRKSGYTANSIFLPANGMKSGSSLSDGGTAGNYWTSSISASYPYYAISPFFDSSSKNSDNCYRYFGLGIRPVYGAVIPVSSIEIPEECHLLLKDNAETYYLSAIILPQNATYKQLHWISSDESIIAVDSKGGVKAVSYGSTTVSAYSADGTKSAMCIVTVNRQAESLSFEKTDIEMFVGDDPLLISAIISPEDAFPCMYWTSSNTSIATVDEKGLVTAVGKGKATITAYTVDGSNLEASCDVSVFQHVESVTLDNTSLVMYVNKGNSIHAYINPSSAKEKGLIWSSSDESIATIEAYYDSYYGFVKAIGLGHATITVSSVDGAKTATCNIDVVPYNEYVQVGESVDLGLSVQWATINIGAMQPEGSGDGFAWGETEPPKNYSWLTYKFRTTGDSYDTVKFNKYCTQSSYWDSTEPMDNKTILDPEDDAAHVYWGGSWRMPTDAEWKELSQKCTWKWTKKNGVEGYLIIGKEEGFTDNSIFLPANHPSSLGHYGWYWSSSLDASAPYKAMVMCFKEDFRNPSNHSDRYGFNGRVVIRPVCPKD